MGSRLEARVRALEQQARKSVGCRTCGGEGLFILDDEAPWPDWLDDVYCRRCGDGVKVYSRSTWDALP